MYHLSQETENFWKDIVISKVKYHRNKMIAMCLYYLCRFFASKAYVHSRFLKQQWLYGKYTQKTKDTGILFMQVWGEEELVFLVEYSNTV